MITSMKLFYIICTSIYIQLKFDLFYNTMAATAATMAAAETTV